MKAAIGQRWLFKSRDYDGFDRSFVCEITICIDTTICYKVIQLINERQYRLGEVATYKGQEFDRNYFTYLDGQDAPK